MLSENILEHSYLRNFIEFEQNITHFFDFTLENNFFFDLS
jgi:hypothetical protein